MSQYDTTLATSQVLPDEVCGVFERYTDPDSLCGQPATHSGSAGCIHEHIITGGICDKHVKTVKDLDGASQCVYCLTGPDPHRCTVNVKVKPL